MVCVRDLEKYLNFELVKEKRTEIIFLLKSPE